MPRKSQAEEIRDINSVGWDGVNANVETLRLTNRQEEYSLDISFKKTFTSEDGKNEFDEIEEKINKRNLSIEAKDKALSELKKLEETYTAYMETTYKEFQTKAQTYAADAANQTEITNQSRQKELECMQKNIQEYQQTVSQDLQKKSVDMMKPLIDKAKAAIDKVASDMGFNYVLDSSVGGSVIIAKGEDIMADVKKELGF